MVYVCVFVCGGIYIYICTRFRMWKSGSKGPLESLGRSKKEDGSTGIGLMRLRSEMNGGFL